MAEKKTAGNRAALASGPVKKTGDWVRVGMSTCGLAAGAQQVFEAFRDEARKRNIKLEVMKGGCLGMCQVEPLVEVKAGDLPVILYSKVTPDVALRILEKHVQGGVLVNDHIVIRKFRHEK
jgi:(2Fe-2S) ferredoxin